MLYAKRDIEQLGLFYAAHLDAMTREGLHSKSDIAAELAFRDARIADLIDKVHEARDDASRLRYPDRSGQ